MKLKSFLAASVLLNIVLAAAAWMAMQNNAARTAPVKDISPAVAAVEAPKAAPIVPVAPAPQVRTMNWNDLISSDDAIYAQNLRAVGCPAATIRDILTAAINRRYDSKRQDLVVQHQQGTLGALELQSATAQSWQEQNNVIGQLSAVASVPAASWPTVASLPANTVRSAGVPVGSVGISTGTPIKLNTSDAGIRVPLALSDPSPSLGLNEAQLAAVGRVSDNFSQTVASQPADPKSPAYHQTWKAAQQNADQQLKAQIGWQLWGQWQMRQVQQSLQIQQ